MGSPPASNELCFAISKSKDLRRYQIHQGDQNGPIIYHAIVHNWKRGAPSVEVRSGSTDNEPMVAFAMIGSSGCKSQIALGDAAHRDSPSVTLDGMRSRTPYAYKEYTFETDELNEKRQHRPYTWIRTKHSPGRFECRDLQSGQVLSEFRSNGFWKWTKLGTVAISMPNPSQRAILYLLLVFLTWSEIENREQATIAAVS